MKWFWLFVFGDCFECFVKVVGSGVYVVICDFEDVVVVDFKLYACDVVVVYLECGRVYVCVNLMMMLWHVDDLVLFVDAFGLEGVILFKVEDVYDVVAVVVMVNCLLIGLIESVVGF